MKRLLRGPRYGGLSPIALTAILLIEVVVISIDYLLIQASLEVFTNERTLLPIVFTATATVGMAGAAILNRRRSTGHEVPGGAFSVAMFVLLWAATVVVVTGIRIFAATVGSDSKPSNLESTVGGGPETVSRWEQFLTEFDPLDSEVVLSFAMALALVFTGLLTYVTTWYAHSPLADLLRRADEIETEAAAGVARAEERAREAVAQRDGWDPAAAKARDEARFQAARTAADARSRILAERLTFEIAARLGDPDATTRLMRQDPSETDPGRPTPPPAAPAADAV